MLQLLYFQNPGGKAPAESYIKRQMAEDKAAMLSAIEAFCEEFPEPVTVNVKALRDKIWEIRIKGAGKKHHRVLYSVVTGYLLVLHAFAKKTNKTPAAEFNIARKRLKQFMN
jgi:phage-related protein